MIHGSIAQDVLKILAESLDDLEKQRIATENRLRSLRQIYCHDDATSDAPEVARLSAILDGIADLEHMAELDLKRALRAHPLGPWVKAATGVGEKTGARLLAAVGDPAWNDLHQRERTLGELWAYCGYHVIDGAAPRRQKGQKANWSNDAKMRTFLCAEACVKAGVRKTGDVDDSDGYDLGHRTPVTPYGEVYLMARKHYLGAAHAVPCHRCTPAGKPPAEPGSPLKASHEHARAMRAVSKAILADLYDHAIALRR